MFQLFGFYCKLWLAQYSFSYKQAHGCHFATTCLCLFLVLDELLAEISGKPKGHGFYVRTLGPSFAQPILSFDTDSGSPTTFGQHPQPEEISGGPRLDCLNLLRLEGTVTAPDRTWESFFGVWRPMLRAWHQEAIGGTPRRDPNPETSYNYITHIQCLYVCIYVYMYKLITLYVYIYIVYIYIYI